jgi:divalent metal cation (Fe/Co/Zn/Cd) transporter
VVSLRLGKKAVDVLLDRAPEGMTRQIEEAALSVPDVVDCPRVRIREGGNTIFVDLTVAVGRNLPLERGHEVADAVEDRIRARVPDADVLVHIEPVEDEKETISERIRVIANKLEMNVHNVVVYELRKKLYVELHLEVDENLNLHDAHEMASRLERGLREQILDIETINSHIESRQQKVAKGHDITARSEEVTSRIREIAETIPGLKDCHNIAVRQVDRKLVVSLHCRFDGATSIRQIHDVSTMIEDRVKSALPLVERVLVHTEPV